MVYFVDQIVFEIELLSRNNVSGTQNFLHSYQEIEEKTYLGAGVYYNSQPSPAAGCII